ncbi:MAG: hypothetical protein MHM6MM_001147 [Cercozoa sp. M6MM]
MSNSDFDAAATLLKLAAQVRRRRQTETAQKQKHNDKVAKAAQSLLLLSRLSSRSQSRTSRSRDQECESAKISESSRTASHENCSTKRTDSEDKRNRPRQVQAVPVVAQPPHLRQPAQMSTLLQQQLQRRMALQQAQLQLMPFRQAQPKAHQLMRLALKQNELRRRLRCEKRAQKYAHPGATRRAESQLEGIRRQALARTPVIAMSHSSEDDIPSMLRTHRAKQQQHCRQCAKTNVPLLQCCRARCRRLFW